MAKWGEIKCTRCAELEAQITAMEEGLTAVHMAGYMDGKKAAEAKLAKAVEQLLSAAEQLDAYVGYGYGDEYREAVAELTGGKDA